MIPDNIREVQRENERSKLDARQSYAVIMREALKRHKFVSIWANKEEEQDLSPTAKSVILLCSILGYLFCGALFHGSDKVDLRNRLLVALLTFLILFPLTLFFTWILTSNITASDSTEAPPPHHHHAQIFLAQA
jgi:H+/Cl- antiporter ClcA